MLKGWTDEPDELELILEAIHDDILIADANGIILKMSKSFETMYGVKREDTIGKTVFEMEERGIFKPSITAIVLNTGEKTTMRQKNSLGRDIVVSAVPILDGDGKILKVISFSRDVTDYLAMQEQYHQMERKIQQYSAELQELRTKVRRKGDIVAESPSMKFLMNLADKVASYDTNVLIAGESGVGKSMLAKYLHQTGSRCQEAFVDINCGAIPENLMESELFGYEAGAFTGAGKTGKAGLIEVADKGTLFLDEISEMPLNLQVKLLKVLQDKSFMRVGGTKLIHSDFRLISASNRNLRQAVERGAFREDLFYRINVINLEIPPLRNRQEDLIHLIARFMEQFNDRYQENKRLSPQVYKHLLNYRWPGNVRELENIIERIIITSNGMEIAEGALPEYLLKTTGEVEPEFFREEPESSEPALSDSVRNLEKEQVIRAYEKHGTTTGVARELGISQPTAYRKVKKYIGIKKK